MHPTNLLDIKIIKSIPIANANKNAPIFLFMVSPHKIFVLVYAAHEWFKPDFLQLHQEKQPFSPLLLLFQQLCFLSPGICQQDQESYQESW